MGVNDESPGGGRAFLIFSLIVADWVELVRYWISFV
jgi:hypothetical protein